MVHHWFVGDIHGCYDALRRLEDRLAAHSEARGATSHVVSVGDLIDRGPQSAQVVQHFRRGSEAGTHSAILGNHEDFLLRCVHTAVPESFGGVPLPRWITTIDAQRSRSPRGSWLTRPEFVEMGRLMWQSQGGTPTLASWGQDPARPQSWRIPQEDLAYLCGLPLIYECVTAVATHALATGEELLLLRALKLANPAHDVQPTDTEYDTFQSVLWRRGLPKMRPDSKLHISGHTPLRRVRRYRQRGLIRVDTGACFGRRLSAFCPELDESMSVSAGLEL